MPLSCYFFEHCRTALNPFSADGKGYAHAAFLKHRQYFIQCGGIPRYGAFYRNTLPVVSVINRKARYARRLCPVRQAECKIQPENYCRKHRVYKCNLQVSSSHKFSSAFDFRPHSAGFFTAYAGRDGICAGVGGGDKPHPRRAKTNKFKLNLPLRLICC